MNTKLRFLNTLAGLAAVSVIGGTSAMVRAQNPAAPAADTTLHAETRVVLVDAVAGDKKGKFARDLTEKNFKLWEDNKEQKISSFSLESAGVSPERSKKHYIAMFFDSTTIGQTGQLVLRQESERFVDGFASPDRYMAVVSYSYNGGARVAQNFTTDGRLVKKALEAVQGSSVSAPTMAQVGSAGGGGGKTPAPDTGSTTIDGQSYRTMLANLRGVVNSMANIRGRKALVFYSGGATVIGDISADLTATIAACNKANVALFTIGGGSGSTTSTTAGSATSSTAPRNTPTRAGAPSALQADTDTTSAGLNSNQTIPRTLSEGTGGMSFVTVNDLANSLGSIAAEQDEYYLIGYTPTADSAEGSCHELRLKVDRGDLDVRSRRGYCTAQSADPLRGKPAGTDLEAKAASGAGNIAAKMQVPWFYAEPNVARVKLALDITPPSMKFQKDKGKLHGEFDLAGVAYKPDGSVAARFSDVVKLDFDNQQQADLFLKAPYHYENQLEVGPGQYNLRMVVGSVGADAQGFGKVEMPLKVEPWNGQTLAASGLALSHNSYPAADMVAGLDGSLLEGRRPLIANGTEVVPAGSSQFHAGEKGFVYFEAYEPLLTTAQADALPLVGVRTRVLDRATGQQKADSGVKTIASFMRAGNPVVPVISPLPSATLPAGAYKLEVTVMRQTGDPIVRMADFDVK